MKVVTAQEMKEIDRRAASEYGIPSLLLMENAGLQVLLEMERRFGSLRTPKVSLFCGKGNNGGDGFVLARHLINKGVTAQVYLLTKREEVKGDARTNLEILKRMGAPLVEITSTADLGRHREEANRSNLIVDAILGTGVEGPVKGLLAEAINMINALGKPVVAVDIPSGLSADSGQVSGPCVRATLTVTLALPKRSLFLYPASRYAGEVRVVDIGIPRPLLSDSRLLVNLLEGGELAGAFPQREPDSHKGDFGHVLILAGSVGKTGAAALAATAALRVGAGLVTLALPESLNDAMEAKLDEVMTEPLPETESRSVSFKALERVLRLIEGKAVLALGPGLSTHPNTVKLVQELVGQVRIPMVIDADGINALCSHLEALKGLAVPLVLTPHPGEFSRLLSINKEEIVANRIEIAQKVAIGFGLHLVLKGAGTIVAHPDGQVYINPTGNPGMATAGTGDVLTGALAGLIAQGLPIEVALRLGVYLHGLAGDIAAREVGEEAMIAGDILASLPAAIRELKGSRHQRSALSD
ncbi:MAG: NAD(P)H-hydrate dehydratase [candidate division NC10 bacterium]|nr:NAD(P)H-hydrate dehydratase [candidate division NC10 bacterium]